MKRLAVLVAGFILGWAVCLAQGLLGSKFAPPSLRVDDGQPWPTDDGSLFWTHLHGRVTRVERRGVRCAGCGAEEPA